MKSLRVKMDGRLRILLRDSLFLFSFELLANGWFPFDKKCSSRKTKENETVGDKNDSEAEKFRLKAVKALSGSNYTPTFVVYTK